MKNDAVNDAAAARAEPFAGATLFGAGPLSDALPALRKGTLLHAGPPLGKDPIPAALRNAVIQAMLFEGMAATETEATRRFDAGAITLEPAQDHGVVTPLAQVVSASMPVLHVGSADHVVFAPVTEGAPPALRFGNTQPACLDNLRTWRRIVLEQLRGVLARAPIPIQAVIQEALENGDECHSRTAAANRALSRRCMDAALRERLDANPSFVLPVIMAGCAWMLQRGPGEIRAAGGNGVRFGLKFKNEAEWRSIPADSPIGTRLPGREHAPVLGAIGDSAIVDLCGLGGQALAFAPALVEEWSDLLPADWRDYPNLLDPRGGLDTRLVAQRGLTPIVHLAMLDGDGRLGLVGRGFYRPSADLFARRT